MKEIEDLEQSFLKSIEDIDKVASFGPQHSRVVNDLLDILVVDLNHLIDKTNVESKVNAVFSQIRKLDEHKELKPLSSVVYGQSIALIVSSFESAMNDLFILMINKYPSVISWSEQKEIKISTELIKFGINTLGEFLLKSIKDKFNFQNIEEVKSFLKTYLLISVESLDQKETDTLIFYSNLRHLVVHNASIVDNQFFIKVSTLKHLEEKIKNKLLLNQKYNFVEDDYLRSKDLFTKFFEAIISEIKKKII
jgi:hypothetical protein